VLREKDEKLSLTCSACKKTWLVKTDLPPSNDECDRCSSTLFVVHSPPPRAASKDKIVYLVCSQCMALKKTAFGELAEIDVHGVLKEA
jgi:hypothetical protein